MANMLAERMIITCAHMLCTELSTDIGPTVLLPRQQCVAMRQEKAGAQAVVRTWIWSAE
jgi:hypothetical protein